MADVPASFDLHAVMQQFPETANSMLLDRYLVDRGEASARVFRVYQPTPAHFHRRSDEHLLVLAGRGRFWMGDPEHITDFGPGTFLFFPRNTVHAMPVATEFPILFLALDVPRREPTDIVFVHPEEGTPRDFIQDADGGSR